MPERVLKAFGSVREVALFLVVGGCVFLVSVVVFRTGKQWLPDVPALTIAFVVAVSVHFVLNNWIVFGGNGRTRAFSTTKVARFMVVLAANYLIYTSVSLVLLRLGTPDYIALGGGIAVSTPVNFLLSRWWVFV